jgi:Cu2+-exporting ATPase
MSPDRHHHHDHHRPPVSREPDLAPQAEVRTHRKADEAHGGHGASGGHHAHGAHAGHGPAMFARRFWWSLAFTLPLVATSHMVMDWFGYELDVPGTALVGPVLGTVLFLWGGWPFLRGGAHEARRRTPGMMLLIAMAITVAYGASMATSLGWFDLDFWWELGALITIMLLGHWQEMKALGQAQDALAALAALLPDEAERLAADGSIESVPVGVLEPGDTVLVRSGARVPADGRIIDGTAELDESMVSGESRPVAKAVGDAVVAGTVSTDSAIRVQVTPVGEQTALAGIGRLVAEAQRSRSRSQVLADRAAALLFYVAVGAAVITAVVWSALGEPDEAVVRVVTVLVISCPHALGLAIPLTTALSSAVGARNGILVKDRLALEASRTVDAVLFDKTGTLTLGQHVVVGVGAVGGHTDDEVVRIAAAVESDSEHPLARAIVRAAEGRGPLPSAAGFRSLTGRGVEAIVDGSPVAVGGPALLRERSIAVPADLRADIEGWEARGAAALYVVEGAQVAGVVALEDEVRPDARQAVLELRRLGPQVVMITGDAIQVAEAVGRDVGVQEVFAEVLPEHKAAKVAELQARGLRVAMVGDGVNDAPALARADVGIAIGAGTDVAMESAGLIVASSDPRGVVSIIELSRAAYRTSLQNLAWAAGYNVVAIPLAAGALQWAGVTLPPAVGALLMSISTIVVALNAQLLRRVDLRPWDAGDTDRPAGGAPGSPAPGTSAPSAPPVPSAAVGPCWAGAGWRRVNAVGGRAP